MLPERDEACPNGHRYYNEFCDHCIRLAAAFLRGPGAEYRTPVPVAILPASPVTAEPPERHIYRCSKGHAWEEVKAFHQARETFEVLGEERCLRCLADVLGKVERID